MQFDWKKDWPTKPGHYWFYGWRFGNKSRHPEVGLCFAFQGGSSLTIKMDSHLILRNEAIGIWKPAQLPTPPDGLLGT